MGGIKTPYVVSAIEYARIKGIPIINLSLGGKQDDSRLRSAIEKYTGVIVCAAGNAEADNDDSKNAVSYYNKALSLNPDNENAYFNIGLVKYDNNEISSAIQNFKKAIELKKDFAFAWWALGACYEKQDKADDAIYNYEKFIEYSSDTELIKSTKEKIRSLYSSLAY